jgi:AmiR/NasT family two-component response regulator
VRRATSIVSRESITVRRALVLCQHEAVRRQLVAYLGRSPALAVSGEPFAPETIVRVRPDVVIVDLSQLGHENLRRAIDAARRVGACLIALASIREPADEDLVRQAGGLYRLKSAGADGLAEVVLDAVTPQHD